MMYVLTEEEYLNLLDSRDDLPKLKATLKKECESISHSIDVYKQLGDDEIVRDLAVRLNTTLSIIDGYL